MKKRIDFSAKPPEDGWFSNPYVTAGALPPLKPGDKKKLVARFGLKISEEDSSFYELFLILSKERGISVSDEIIISVSKKVTLRPREKFNLGVTIPFDMLLPHAPIREFTQSFDSERLVEMILARDIYCSIRPFAGVWKVFVSSESMGFQAERDLTEEEEAELRQICYMPNLRQPPEKK